MRINVYKEEITSRIEVLEKTVDGKKFIGCRFYLELPVTQPMMDSSTGKQVGNTIHRGPFMHRPGDDDSSAVTFWHDNPFDLQDVLRKAIDAIERRVVYNPKSEG